MKGKRLRYTYDAGSSTTLWIRGGAEDRVAKAGGPVRLLARDEPPRHDCACGSPAESVGTECLWEEDADSLLCAACAGGHDCGEEMLLPLVNSPRAGTCGYTGLDPDPRA